MIQAVKFLSLFLGAFMLLMMAYDLAPVLPTHAQTASEIKIKSTEAVTVREQQPGNLNSGFQ